MATTGQTINDRINAVRYALVGQGLARTVCKATTEEILGPKKKHLDYLLACTNEPNVSIPQLANLLIERTQHSCWAVVFKALVSIHHLMSSGNEKFKQYLATSNHSFELNDFMDRTTPQGYGMSTFVRRYAKYINEKTVSYRTLALDLCKIRSGNDNALRTMNMDNLSKTLPIVQSQFDSLLEFGADTKDLNNGVIMAAFRQLYKDLVRLYVAYQEAIINLLERYFKLSRRKTREALDMYKKYLARMDRVAGFLRVVEAVDLDKSEMPDLTNSPASILEILEKHLAQLEAKKRGATPASPDQQQQQDDDSETRTTQLDKENEPPGGAGAGGKPAEPSGKSSPTSSTNSQVQHQQQQQQKSPATDKPTAAAPSDAKALSPGGSATVAKKPVPARPSPLASPKISPSSSGPKAPSGVAAAAAAAPPTTTTTAASAEKKASPPERPAKPPSRPPPPAATAPPPPVAAAGSAAPSNQPGAGSSGSSGKSPPAHPPPPPSSAPKVAAPVSPGNPQATTSPAANQTPEGQTATTPQEPGEAESSASSGYAGASDENGTAASEDQATAPSVTCSSGAAEQVAAVEQAPNHVSNNNGSSNNNNNDNHHAQASEDEEMPPPPPPIEDDEHQVAPAAPDEQQPENITEQVQQPDQHEAPRVNGSNGAANENANDNNGDGDAPPPPPPPPPAD